MLSVNLLELDILLVNVYIRINNGKFSSAPKQASGLKIIFRNFRNVSKSTLW